MANKNKAVEENYCTMQYSSKCRNKNGINPASNYYSSGESKFYSNGKFNICKDCIREFVYIDNDINIDNFKTILRIFDIPFFQKDFDSAVLDKKETIGTYMKNIAFNHKSKTWLDGDVDVTINTDSLTDNGFEVTKAVIKRWGKGYTADQYEEMEETYNEWCSNYSDDTLSERKTYKMLTLKEMDISIAREQGKPTDKLEETYRKFMQDANVVPKDKDDSKDESNNSKTWGTITEDIERVSPAEYYKHKKLYKDFDGFVEYLNRFIFRPIKNILTKTKEYDKEFTIEENVDLFTDGDDIEQ